jgi:hypothetical protein
MRIRRGILTLVLVTLEMGKEMRIERGKSG